MLAGVMCVASQRWNVASSAVALACLFKIYPIALGCLLGAIHPRRFAGRFLLALAMGLAFPMCLQRPHYVLAQYSGWWEELTQEDRQSEPPKFWYRDLRLLCHSCHIPLSKSVYLGIQLTTAAAFAILCIAARRKHLETRRLLAMLFGLAGCWMTVFGLAAESSTYILLAPSLAWALLSAWAAPHPRWVQYLLVASYALFSVAAMAVWFPWGRQVHTLGPQPLAGLLLLIGLLATELPWLITTPVQHHRVDQTRLLQAA